MRGPAKASKARLRFARGMGPAFRSALFGRGLGLGLGLGLWLGLGLGLGFTTLAAGCTDDVELFPVDNDPDGKADLGGADPGDLEASAELGWTDGPGLGDGGAGDGPLDGKPEDLAGKPEDGQAVGDARIDTDGASDLGSFDQSTDASPFNRDLAATDARRVVDADYDGDGPQPPGPDAMVGGDGGTLACPATHLGGNDPASCAGALSANRLRYALCACGSLSPQGEVQTSAFDSSGAVVPTAMAAALGCNLSLDSAFPMTIGGSLTSGGRVSCSASWSVAESLRAGGAVQVQPQGSLQVSGSAWVVGTPTGKLSVSGTLYVPMGVTPGPMVQGVVVQKPVSVSPPCNCAPVVGLDAQIQAHGAHNDNALLHLGHDGLEDNEMPRTVDVPCGEFHTMGLGTRATLTLAVHGRAVFYVEGPIDIQADLVVQLDAGAELDIVSNGTFGMRQGGRFGDLLHPARVRLWLTGNTMATLAGSPIIAAAVHAPSTTFYAPSGLDLRGAALLQSVAVEGHRLSISYDRAILGGGALSCGTAPETPVQ